MPAFYSRIKAAFAVYEPIALMRLKLRGGVVSLPAGGKERGRVLLSYTTLPFIARPSVLGGHTNQWECAEMARLFRERGYGVDVIDSTDRTFVPHARYRYFIDVHANMERLAPRLNADCVKILHATTSYWKFQNEAELARIAGVHKRRGATLTPRRALAASRAYEIADEVTMLGNTETEATYPGGKMVTRIPLSTTHIFPSPETKDFNAAKTRFIWLGGSGMVHKGLDLVLEAFAETPEFELAICGKVENETDFVAAYRKELYELPNIKLHGLTDPGSTLFDELRERSVALIYPSSSEGQSGAVVLCMHAGLIPIVSRNAGVDVGDFGLMLERATVEEVRDAVRAVATMSADELKRRSIGAWEYARTRHTRESFSRAYAAFIERLEKKYASE